MFLPVIALAVFLWGSAAIGGSIICLAGVTDPNTVPNRRRQSLFPLGASLALSAGLLLVGMIVGAGLGAFVYGAGRDLSDVVPILTGFVGGSLGAVAGAVLGFVLGRARNRRFWAAQRRARDESGWGGGF